WRRAAERARAQSVARVARAPRARVDGEGAAAAGGDGWGFARLVADGDYRGPDDRVLVTFVFQRPFFKTTKTRKHEKLSRRATKPYQRLARESASWAPAPDDSLPPAHHLC